MSMIMFAFIITTLFSKAKTAAAVGGLGYDNVFNLFIFQKLFYAKAQCVILILNVS